MATEAQFNANRANAQKSTGPATDAGKASACQNALKTGIYAESDILKTENPEELAQLTAEFYADHNPTTAAARELVDALIEDAWRKRRLRRGEACLYNHLDSKVQDTPEEHREGHVLEIGLIHLIRIDRMRQAINRSFNQNLDKLHELESRQPEPASEPTPDPQPDPEPPAAAQPDISTESSTAQTTAKAGTKVIIGFVSSNVVRFPFSPARNQANCHLIRV